MKLLLNNVTQIAKKLSMGKGTRTILIYGLNPGSWLIRNFSHGYPRVWKATINHTTPIQNRIYLHLHEKVERVHYPEETLSNKYSEVICQSCHWNRYELTTLVSNKKNCGVT